MHALEVINRLNTWSAPIRVDESRFGQKLVKLLGFLISGKGAAMDPKMVEALKTWPKPKTTEQSLRILGSANFHRQFAPNCSMIMRPLDTVRKQKGAIK